LVLNFLIQKIYIHYMINMINEEDVIYIIDLDEIEDNDKTCYDVVLSQLNIIKSKLKPYNNKNNKLNKKENHETKYKCWSAELV